MDHDSRPIIAEQNQSSHREAEQSYTSDRGAEQSCPPHREEGRDHVTEEHRPLASLSDDDLLGRLTEILCRL
jgi:hypothetical protein